MKSIRDYETPNREKPREKQGDVFDYVSKSTIRLVHCSLSFFLSLYVGNIGNSSSDIVDIYILDWVISLQILKSIFVIP